MARTTFERQLTPACSDRFDFAVASHNEDVEIRSLLRENPMEGSISLSFEREPNYFADGINPFEAKRTIVARERGRVVCMGSCAVRRRFVEGNERSVGYLGGLRLAASHAGQTEILRAGYEFFHQLELESPADFYFTSIASDNRRARRLLERGLPGMPVYEFVGELVTLMLPAKWLFRRTSKSGLSGLTPDALSKRLNDNNRNYQLAPVWSADELEILSDLGLQRHKFFRCGDASGALWDQSCFKQTVIRRYASGLGKFRPAANAWAWMTGGIRLPALGEQIRNAYVSHIIAGDTERDLPQLLRLLQSVAGHAGLELLTIAFAADDPRLNVVREISKAREYYTRIYLVHWSDCGNGANGWKHHVLAPEVALL